MNGILLIDKPPGKSSAFIDRICKRILGIKKVGHIGTLDPFATGVLPIALNAGTKIIPFIKTSKKTYDFEIKFGIKTDTGDNTGRILSTSTIIPNPDEVAQIIQKFIGEQYQKPHPFSAVKINGVPAYRMARRGELPDIQSKLVTIFDLCILGKQEDRILFRAVVSPGTYIRSLAEDMATSLGTVGHVISLRRIVDGKFSIENSITIDKLEEKKDNICDVLISLEDALDDIPVFFVLDCEARDLTLGRSVACEIDRMPRPGLSLASSRGGFLGIVDVVCGGESCILSPKRLLVFGKRSDL
ncbi:MAG: tRNA pseudouridine(55) synthase TruB [Holosporales bacterium]|jgi:tRNA pseudouridine55 synthase|nr:tRNA pseudouridine(55) synthase TruB [Holosporales bacterium]